MKSGLLALSFCLLLPLRNAWATVGVNGNYVTGTISFIQSAQDGRFTITLSGQPFLCDSGNAGVRTHATFLTGTRQVTAEGTRNALSVAMAAYLAGKTVRIYTDNGVPTVGWGCTAFGIDVFNP